MAPYIPVLIFCARICDVSLGTMRMILVISGSRWLAAVLGFFEVIIWALAVGGMIRFLTEPFALMAYAAGFACGTLVGIRIEERIAMGFRLVRVINSDMSLHVSEALREQGGFRVTRIEGSGRGGPVEIAFLVVKRRDLRRSLEMVQEIAPDAFITVERADRATGAAFSDDLGVAKRSLGKMGGVRK